MTGEQFNALKDTIPAYPGVYQFYDNKNTIIYVGKAVSLKSRVASYFQSSHQLSQKTQELVKNTVHLDWIACPNEHDALLLENNLIKKWQPKYNINLKDDKTYPYIVIKEEPFPRVYMTRNKVKNARSEYFGPYTSVHIIRELIQHIRAQVPLRTCSLNLSENAIKKNKYRPCLEFHIEKCNAPCIGRETREQYDTYIQQIRLLLKGNFKSLIQEYNELMKQKSDLCLFEEAQQYKEKIQAIEQLQHKSFFNLHSNEDWDICAFQIDEGIVWVYFSLMRCGSILQSKIMQFSTYDTEVNDDVFATLVVEIRSTFQSECKQLLSNIDLPLLASVYAVKVPLKGIKKAIIQWSLDNIGHHIKNHQLQIKKEDARMNILQEMQSMLRLPSLPKHIECFDNSHFQGASQVSAMICFKNGMPCKKEYRTFHIKSTHQIDDFASMREVIYRRYLRRINEGKALPDLIIVDGGKGQLNAALRSLDDLQLKQKVSVLAIAKKQEVLFFAEDKDPIILSKHSPILKLIQEIRDETHRFVIQFHRKTQVKKSLNVEGED